MERIVAAAIKVNNLVMFVERPGRHHSAIHALIKLFPNMEDSATIPINGQGFVTSEGRYVNRVEGLRIAQAANQIIKKHPRESELYSEDMW